MIKGFSQLCFRDGLLSRAMEFDLDSPTFQGRAKVKTRQSWERPSAGSISLCPGLLGDLTTAWNISKDPKTATDLRIGKEMRYLVANVPNLFPANITITYNYKVMRQFRRSAFQGPSSSTSTHVRRATCSARMGLRGFSPLAQHISPTTGECPTCQDGFIPRAKSVTNLIARGRKRLYEPGVRFPSILKPSMWLSISPLQDLKGTLEICVATASWRPSPRPLPQDALCELQDFFAAAWR